jgi:ubiquinone/menaquinone biosynthesis C-methylase UbiE
VTDYDLTDIPAAYDRARDHGPEVLDLWMRTVADSVAGSSIRRILDLGCGTGRFTEALAEQFNATVIGLDPSIKMLEVARKKQRDPRVRYEIGHAESMPLSSESVDLIFMSMALHHFTNRIGAAQECRRVLSEHGAIAIRTATSEQISAYPYVPFFPSSRELLEKVLPARADVVSTFAAAELELLGAKVITQTIASDWRMYADKLAAGGDSVLAKLGPREFATGLEALREHAEREGHGPVVEPIDFFVFAIRNVSVAAA